MNPELNPGIKEMEAGSRLEELYYKFLNMVQKANSFTAPDMTVNPPLKKNPDGTIAYDPFNPHIPLVDEAEVNRRLKVYIDIQERNYAYEMASIMDSIANENFDDSVKVYVESDGGTTIRNGEGERVLTARVYRNGEEVTDLIPPTYFSWKKKSLDPEADEAWTAAHQAVGNVVTVTSADIWMQAVFQCDVVLGWEKSNE